MGHFEKYGVRKYGVITRKQGYGHASIAYAKTKADAIEMIMAFGYSRNEIVQVHEYGVSMEGSQEITVLRTEIKCIGLKTNHATIKAASARKELERQKFGNLLLLYTADLN